ncbi:MAG: glycogen-binding domain-containing protein [Treponema sp.]|nr:glycogen-binding domain-containing protein [Treponema sp.]
MVTQIKEVRAPYLIGDYLIFTAEKTADYVGIAFDFENFHTIHPYQIHNTYNADNEIESSLLFYILKLNKNQKDIKYRIVVDGLWTLDPTNPRQLYDKSTGLILSQVDASRTIPPATEINEKAGTVRFVYVGKTGQQIRLGGSFTNWDSWIYEMEEVKPGLYEFEISLPPGTYQYAYFTGVTSMVDRTNPERCYTRDGKEASLIVVK